MNEGLDLLESEQTRDGEETEDVNAPDRVDGEDGLQDEGERREQWDNPVEFLLSCISMSVGIGNVWRFPFTAYENGGGAFLIPYLIVLILICRPFYLLELGLGQFSSRGCVKIWDLCPPFRGIGYAQSFATLIVCSYYCELIAVSIYYLVVSCSTTLPWSICHEELAQPNKYCLPSNSNISSLNSTLENKTMIASSEQYFRVGVLKENSDMSQGIGYPDPALTGCLVLCWVLIFGSLYKGVKSSGKVAYFTALFPYVVILTLLVRGLTLDGAVDGVIFLFNPQWQSLYDPKVWYAAVTQSFFSLSIGFGVLPSFASYNTFKHNIYRDASIVAVMDTLTSLLAAVITFSIIGHLSKELQVPMDKVVKSGAGLAFISYPEILTKFQTVPQLFAVLFFLMLITLGLGSATGLMNTVITILTDDFPKVSKSIITGGVCLLGFATGKFNFS